MANLLTFLDFLNKGVKIDEEKPENNDYVDIPDKIRYLKIEKGVPNDLLSFHDAELNEKFAFVEKREYYNLNIAYFFYQLMIISKTSGKVNPIGKKMNEKNLNEMISNPKNLSGVKIRNNVKKFMEIIKYKIDKDLLNIYKYAENFILKFINKLDFKNLEKSFNKHYASNKAQDKNFINDFSLFLFFDYEIAIEKSNFDRHYINNGNFYQSFSFDEDSDEFYLNIDLIDPHSDIDNNYFQLQNDSLILLPPLNKKDEDYKIKLWNFIFQTIFAFFHDEEFQNFLNTNLFKEILIKKWYPYEDENIKSYQYQNLSQLLFMISDLLYSFFESSKLKHLSLLSIIQLTFNKLFNLFRFIPEAEYLFNQTLNFYFMGDKHLINMMSNDKNKLSKIIKIIEGIK